MFETVFAWPKGQPKIIDFGNSEKNKEEYKQGAVINAFPGLPKGMVEIIK